VREHNDGLYRPLVYLVFKMVDELAINWAAGLLSCAIMFFGIQLQGSFFYFWLMLQATLANGVGARRRPVAPCSSTAAASSAGWCLFLHATGLCSTCSDEGGSQHAHP
jgi:hypothetical protein